MAAETLPAFFPEGWGRRVPTMMRSSVPSLSSLCGTPSSALTATRERIRTPASLAPLAPSHVSCLRQFSSQNQFSATGTVGYSFRPLTSRGALLELPECVRCIVMPTVLDRTSAQIIQTAACKHRYERSAIESWFMNHDTSPRTNDKLLHKVTCCMPPGAVVT